MKPQAFHSQATFHIGVIHFRDSGTPIGVNAFGLCFEDACYCLESEQMTAFECAVTHDLQYMRTSGVFLGGPWHYVGATSCHRADSLND